MKKIALALLIVIAAVAVAFLSLAKGPDLSSYEILREPRITTMQDRRMIVVELKGDPNVVGKRAFSLLYKTYYKLDGVPKWSHQPAPIVRWSGDMNNKETWVGRYALPVPETITSLPEAASGDGLRAELVMWEYGTVAEILHIGSYAAEYPTIVKLRKFIKDSGYAVAGYHEEEYVKGPGMFFKGNPDRYYTVIRYRIAKAGP